jgi:hypothetical protein
VVSPIEHHLLAAHARRRRRAPGSIAWGVVGITVGAVALTATRGADPLACVVAILPAFFGALSLVRGLVALIQTPLQ